MVMLIKDSKGGFTASYLESLEYKDFLGLLDDYYEVSYGKEIFKY